MTMGRMHAPFVRTLIVLSLSAFLQAQRPGTPASLAITHVTVVDVPNGSTLGDMTVLISGDRISAVGRSTAIAPQAASVVDGSRKFLIPGLWDMHVHMFNNADGTGADYSDYFFPLLIANGIVGVRDMWSDPAGVDLIARMRYAPPQPSAWVARAAPADMTPSVRRTMRRTGLFLSGTDFSIQRPRIVPGFSLHDELQLFVEQGHTAAEALQAATFNAAKYMAKLGEFGTVEQNRRADLVLLDADPLADIHNTSRIRAVVLNGRFLDRPMLDALLAKAEAAAKKIPVRSEPTVSFVITGTDTAFAGRWDALFPGFGQTIAINLNVDRATLTGTVRAGAQTLPVEQGRLVGTTMAFKVKSPDGNRVVSLTGNIDGEAITFTRDVDVAPGGAPGGQGFFGARGAPTFTARRVR